MIYKNKNGIEICNLEEWKNQFFKNEKEMHWVKGRSAYSIADFMINKNGEKSITDVLSLILKEKVALEIGYPEMEVRFDNFGHGREHDIGIWGQTVSNKKVFIGLESKVDESFNEKIIDTYLKAKCKELNGISSNAAKRIDGILKRCYKTVKPDHFNLRYQLLYSTLGTIDAKNENGFADISIMMIIIFKTNNYVEENAKRNHNDYIQFIESFDREKIVSNDNFEAHRLFIEDKEMYSVYMNVDA
jgi:hypothetical protein